MFVIAGIGFVAGMYLTFRSECGIASGLFRLLYGLFVMEIMFGGGGAALAMHIASRLDLSWWAFYTNCIIAMLSLFVGMYREADTLELWVKDVAWRSKLKKYIDYSSQQLDPTVTATSLSPRRNSHAQFPFWPIAIVSINLPLLFEAYVGGRNNAVFLAVPVLTSVFAYINLKHCGPGLVRLLLLRKLEKEAGFRFVNADYEQIQELRRTFFLARWFMKDYVKKKSVPIPSARKR